MPGKRILLVDDEPELLKAMRIRLTSWDYDVLTAANGKEAIQLVQKEAPDAIILDIIMPEMDGIETLKRIRRSNKEVPVFMLTAYGDAETFEETRRLGIAGFIHKGTEFENASEFIRVALKGQNWKGGEMDRKRILVVDDEVELVKALQIRLAQENYEVLIAYDGKEGLQKAQEYKPDLIILDILTPKMEGDSVAAALRQGKETRDIPIIFLTCLAEGLTEKPEGSCLELAVEARFSDGNLSLGKPFETEELVSMVKSLLLAK